MPSAPRAEGADHSNPDWHREERESPVHWLLRITIECGATVATVEDWSEAGWLTLDILLAAIDAGALEVVGAVPRRAARTTRVTSEALLTLLSRELVYASQLECPPVWRRTLPASVERRRRRSGLRTTRTRPATVVCRGGRAA